MNFAHGAVTWLAADAATTTYTVSGLSFQPKALRFYWQGLASATDTASGSTTMRRGVGFAVGTADRRCVGCRSVVASANVSTHAGERNDAIACTLTGTAFDGLLDLNSITSDGFTLIVDDQAPVDLTIFWEAWGGSDITVAVVGDIAEPASTGNVDYTVTGFVAAATDQVVMFAGCQSTAAINTAQAQSSGFSVGFATGGNDADNVVVTGNNDAGSAAADTDGYGRAGECLVQIAVAGGNPTGRAKLTQFGTDNFRLNWIAATTTNRRSIFLALKGGGWKAAAYTINGNTGSATASVSGLAFTPLGVCLIGRMTTESAAGTSTAQDRQSWGTGSSTTSRRSMGCLDEDAADPTEIDLAIEYDQVLVFPSTSGGVQAAYDISAIASDGFTIIVDTAGGVASEWQGYLTFGTTSGTISKSGAESLAVKLTETGRLQANAVKTESLVRPVTETANLQAALRAVESLPVGLVETARLVVALARGDTLGIGLAEASSVRAIFIASESVPIRLTEASAIRAALTVSESLKIGLSEAALLVAMFSTSASERVGLTEESRLAVALTTSESLALRLQESASIRAALTVSDPLHIGLIEDSPHLQAAFAVGESLGCGLTDAARLVALLAARQESLPIHLDEVSILVAGIVSVAGAETVPLGFTEASQTILAVIRVAEALQISIGESASILARLSAVDSLRLGLLEIANVVVSIQAATDCPVGLAEQAAIAVALLASDAARVQVTETAQLLVLLNPRETTALGVQEVIHILAALRAAETVAVLEQSMVNQVPAVIGRDTVVIQLNEQAIVVTTIQPLGHVIVATVKSLVPARTLTAVGVLRTILGLGVTRTVEVL